MFGNSQSYNNIFGSAINDSHQRLFGGDRMLSTKDIEGAQPRKYNRHVWGDNQQSNFQNILSFDPQNKDGWRCGILNQSQIILQTQKIRSTIKSTILGDNVQPLNRAIPNSSALIFRDPNSQSLTQKMYTQQSQNQFRSPQNKVGQTEPTPKVSQIQPYTQVQDRKSVQNQLSFTNVMRDSKNQQYQANSPQIYQSNGIPSEKYQVRRIEPPSQLREQNIFSLPDYTNKSAAAYVKPMINQSLVPYQNESKQEKKSNLNLQEKMEQYKQMRNYQPIQSNQQSDPATVKNIIGSSRSPDAYIPFEPTPKDYQRDSISSYALGQKNDPAVEKFHPNKALFYQQPSKSPVFQLNRNYGPDDVLTGPQTIENRESISSYEFGSFASPRQKQGLEQGRNSPIKQEDNIRPSSNRNQQAIQQSNYSQQGFRPPSNQNQINNEVEKAVRDNNEYHQNQQVNEDKVISQQYIPQRPSSNPQQILRPASYNNNQGQPIQQQSNDNQIQVSQDTLRLRSVLSSRARHLLNSKQIEQTANSEYGLYAAYSNRNTQTPKEKVLYQSKRDNFLRSHLPRSQSAEGIRLLRNQGDSQNNQEQTSLQKSPNQQSLLPKYGQWGLKNYNIIGNYLNPYKYEGRKGDPFADIKYIGRYTTNSINNKLQPSKNLGEKQSQNNEIQTEPAQNNGNQVQSVDNIEFRKSGFPRSPIAGVSNEYDETNRKFNALYHQQKPQEHNQVKYYGAKALKNLSNIKLY